MNPERLLAEYERVADAPDAIGRLRRLILDLAVRGTLVSQNQKDEPASQLLKRIAAEKARLVNNREIRKLKSLPAIDGDDVPYELPSGWTWARIREITSDRGQTVPDSDFTYIDVTAINKEKGYIEGAKVVSAGEAPSRARKIVRRGDVLYSCVRPYLLNIAIVEEELYPPPIASTAFAVLNGFGLILPRYQWIVLRSPMMVARVENKMRGQAYPAINDSDFALLPFPVAPLAEQRRIVDKVDQMMALCDRLENARREREATRDRFAAASLARLNAPDSASFLLDAGFALEHMPSLTARPDQIEQLRQAILNLAVRGKLVPRDPTDEPAADLLNRIAADRLQMVKHGMAKRPVLLPKTDSDQAPFDLPVGWAWARFPEVGTIRRGRSKHRPRNDPALFEGGSHLMIQTGDVARSKGVIKTYTSKYNDLGLAQSFMWPKGTLCITIAANIADSGILGFDACFPDSVVGFVPSEMFRNAKYFEYFMRTAKANLLEFAPATAQKNINLEILTAVMIPLPPIPEQHRIVAKVDELMELCDRIQRQLADGSELRSHLFRALVTETIAAA